MPTGGRINRREHLRSKVGSNKNLRQVTSITKQDLKKVKANNFSKTFVTTVKSSKGTMQSRSSKSGMGNICVPIEDIMFKNESISVNIDDTSNIVKSSPGLRKNPLKSGMLFKKYQDLLDDNKIDVIENKVSDIIVANISKTKSKGSATVKIFNDKIINKDDVLVCKSAKNTTKLRTGQRAVLKKHEVGPSNVDIGDVPFVIEVDSDNNCDVAYKDKKPESPTNLKSCSSHAPKQNKRRISESGRLLGMSRRKTKTALKVDKSPLKNISQSTIAKRFSNDALEVSDSSHKRKTKCDKLHSKERSTLVCQVTPIKISISPTSIMKSSKSLVTHKDSKKENSRETSLNLSSGLKLRNRKSALHAIEVNSTSVRGRKRKVAKKDNKMSKRMNESPKHDGQVMLKRVSPIKNEISESKGTKSTLQVTLSKIDSAFELNEDLVTVISQKKDNSIIARRVTSPIKRVVKNYSEGISTENSIPVIRQRRSIFDVAAPKFVDTETATTKKEVSTIKTVKPKTVDEVRKRLSALESRVGLTRFPEPVSKGMLYVKEVTTDSKKIVGSSLFKDFDELSNQLKTKNEQSHGVDIQYSPQIHSRKHIKTLHESSPQAMSKHLKDTVSRLKSSESPLNLRQRQSPYKRRISCLTDDKNVIQSNESEPREKIMKLEGTPNSSRHQGVSYKKVEIKTNNENSFNNGASGTDISELERRIKESIEKTKQDLAKKRLATGAGMLSGRKHLACQSSSVSHGNVGTKVLTTEGFGGQCYQSTRSKKESALVVDNEIREPTAATSSTSGSKPGATRFCRKSRVVVEVDEVQDEVVCEAEDKRVKIITKDGVDEGDNGHDSMSSEGSVGEIGGLGGTHRQGRCTFL